MALSLSVQITRCSAKKYGINHLTSSPYWPQGNGKAESAVKIVKSLLKKSDEFELALLHYLNTPPKGHTLSPVQRSFGRRTRHILPVSKEALAPQSHSSRIVQAEIAAKHSSAKVSYDRHAHVDLSDNFSVGEYAYAKPSPHHRGQAWQYGEILRQEGPRSFVLSTKSGEIRRNQCHLRPAAPPSLNDLKPRQVAVSHSFAHLPTSTSSVQSASDTSSATAFSRPNADSAVSADLQSDPPTELSATIPPKVKLVEEKSELTSVQQPTVCKSSSTPARVPTLVPVKGQLSDSVTTRSGRVVKRRVILDPS